MRKLFAVPVVLAASLVGLARPAQAQENKCHIICAPAFVAQPGLVVSNAINAPAAPGGGSVGSATHFLARFTTVFGTAIPRTAFVALVQWMPENKGATDPITGKQFNSNAPAFVYGPVFSLFDAGPVNFSLDALGVYAPGGTSSSYHHVFAMEGIGTLSVGHMLSMMGSSPSAYMKGMAINVLYSQQLSDRLPDASGSRKLTPNLLFLLTLPIAPLP